MRCKIASNSFESTKPSPFVSVRSKFSRIRSRVSSLLSFPSPSLSREESDGSLLPEDRLEDPEADPPISSLVILPSLLRSSLRRETTAMSISSASMVPFPFRSITPVNPMGGLPPGARSRSPGARSRSPGARSRSPGARSRSPGARSRSPGARSAGALSGAWAHPVVPVPSIRPTIARYKSPLVAFILLF